MKYFLVTDSIGREYLLDSETGEVLIRAWDDKISAEEMLRYFNLDYETIELA